VSFPSFLASPAPFRLVSSLALVAAALGLAGCSAAIPLPAFVSKDDVTGSIRKPVSPLSASLDAEDWRRASGALAVALDPQGSGAPVRWDNPTSGTKGVFTPVGDAQPVDGRICRAFLSELGGAHPVQSLQGTGCRDKSGDWEVTDVKPWKKA
jgi:surface antigen